MIRIGTSGWSYRHWRGNYYPQDLPVRKELDYLLARFSTIEVNRTFYSLGKPAWFRDWFAKAPDQFRYAVKGSRFITHIKRLQAAERPLVNFFASGLIELGHKLGPILWQLPSGLEAEVDRIDKFLGLLPPTMGDLADLAGQHRLQGEVATSAPDRSLAVRHAIEIRDRPQDLPGLLDVLKHHLVALVASHSSRWPYLEECTSDFRYLRLHGPRELYASAYSPDELRDWALRLKVWAATQPAAEGTDIFVYFDNDGHGFAPRQVEDLESLITDSAP